MIYLDNAASSWPKPPEVSTAMVEAIQEYAANPGRGSHQLAIRASQKIQQTRMQLAKLFRVKNPNDVVFTKNVTESLNIGLKGFLKAGDHVITTSLEHNSVRRPLEYLRKSGIGITYLKTIGTDDEILRQIEHAITNTTKLIVVTHASNLTGRILPIEQIGAIARKHQLTFMVDAAQTAGFSPIDVDAMKIDMLAFTGHKSLYGPQGTGGLYIHPEIELEPLLHGGTGGFSELIEQPPTRPDRYESGTQNTVGIAGLSAGLEFIERIGLEQIQKHENALTDLLLDQISEVKGVQVYVAESGARCPIVSFSIEGFSANEIGFILDTHYEIAVRSGLHCSPIAHETLHTTEEGLVRASIGYFNTEKQIRQFVDALKDITG